MGSLKVLHILTDLYPSGAQTSVADICMGLRSRGLDAGIIYSSTGRRELPDGLMLWTKLMKHGVPLYDVPEMVREISPWRDLIALGKLRSLIRRHRPAVVHTHMSKAGVLGRLAAALEGVPHILHSVRGWSFYGVHSRFRRHAYVLVERAMARRTRRLLAVSEQAREDGVRAGIGRPADYRLVRSGIALGVYRQTKARSGEVRAALGIPADVAVVGSVMRLSQQKAPLDFVAVCARVARQCPGVHFLVVGEGPMRTAMQRAIAEADLCERFHLPGHRPDVPELLAQMDVFLLTSHWEGLPRVLVEAAASRIPIVATEVGGTPEIVVDGQNGRLAAPGDTETLARLVIGFLTTQEARGQMRDEAESRLDLQFDLATVVKQHEDIYEELMAPRGEQ